MASGTCALQIILEALKEIRGWTDATTSALLGMSFDRFNLETGEIEPFKGG
jgi:hypothetical protein